MKQISYYNLLIVFSYLVSDINWSDIFSVR